ncbi:MAG: hypothetical protein ACI8XG_001472 [Congregibacter sp.]|jgi:hypothetical protein
MLIGNQCSKIRYGCGKSGLHDMVNSLAVLIYCINGLSDEYSIKALYQHLSNGVV